MPQLLRILGGWCTTGPRARRVGTVALTLVLASAATARAEEVRGRGLPDYRTEVQWLVEVPGASSSIAAGLLNPGAWAVQPEGGLFFGWRDSTGRDDQPKSWVGVLSAHHLAFAMQRHQLQRPAGGWTHLDEYTLGLSMGDAGSALGVSYVWSRGAEDLLARDRRLVVGSVSRWSWLSLGLAGQFDVEHKDNLWNADVGLRPFGPRLTLFADAVQYYRQSFEDITLGYGLELRPIPGLALAGKLQDDERWGLRLEIVLPGAGTLRAGARMHFDESRHRTTTYALETGSRRAPLGYGLLERGQRFPEIKLKGQMAYRRYRFFDSRRTLLGTLYRLARAGEDPRVGGVVLNLSGMQIDGEMLWELRAQLAGLRARGKRVIVYLDRMGMGGYMLASVADQIWMEPVGELNLNGLRAGGTFYHDALEKLGIGFDELRFFTYKSAFESFARSSMSPAAREQLQVFIDDVYDTIAREVTAARGISAADWDGIIDRPGSIKAKEAQTLGLVDSIGTYPAAQKAARRTPRRATPDATLSPLAGVLGDPVWAPQTWGRRPRIALLYGIGECAMDTGIRGPALARAIRTAKEDDGVKAIVFRADSPGGDALPSDLVARELRQAAEVKPVLVSQGRVAGSGGYWISMYGKPIVTAPLSLTGSIGVIGAWVWDESFGQKLGLTYDGVKRGEHADLGGGISLPLLGAVIPHRPMTEVERARAEEEIFTLYDDFVEKVAAAREMSTEAVNDVGQGRIWSGRRAVANGLADSLGGLWDALRWAKAAAGIAPRAQVVITQAPELGAFDLSALLPGPILRVLAPGAARRARSAGRGEDGDPALEETLRAMPGLAHLPAAERQHLGYLFRSRGRPFLRVSPEALDDLAGEGLSACER